MDARAALLTLSLAGTTGGAVAAVAGASNAASASWVTVSVIGLAVALRSVAAEVRRGRTGVDVVAVLALAGALAVGEHLAAAVVAVMLASGRLLEGRAAARAERDLRTLLDRAPRVAHRYTDGDLREVDLDDVGPGDLLLVGTGEVVPVDGRVDSVVAVLDESALTGEALPVERATGGDVRSGVVNAGPPFDLRATARAADSTYARIVRLVQQAQASSAPLVRLADRYAALFVPLALVFAGLAWAVSGDPVRAVAVLVVATPCPLLLAAPVAIVSGLSQAARRGIVVKGGGALEELGRAQVLLFDKTGTLTAGRPTLAEVVTCAGLPADDVLRLAASLDRVSPHLLATALVRAARERGLVLSLPAGTEEVPGRGIGGLVDGRRVRVGRADWAADGPVSAWARRRRRQAVAEGSMPVFVGVDGELAGAVVLRDAVRPDAVRMIRSLRRAGIRRVVMVTGDRRDVAETVGGVVGVDEVLAERLPAEKADAVRAAGRLGVTVMVGDGVNDAPALATASVGVALAARGATASSEAADVVLTVDRLDRLGEAMQIARRSRRIALQSVIAGMAMSLVAMLFAAVGLLPPVAGAVLQEGIDVAVILNALRALRPGPPLVPRLPEDVAALGRRYAADHVRLRPGLRLLVDAATALDGPDCAAEARRAHAFLVEQLLPHEQSEHAELYPALDRVLGSDTTGTAERERVEVVHLVARLGRLLDELPASGCEPDDVHDLQRVLYGLHALLSLHFSQEEQEWFALVDGPVGDGRHSRAGRQNAPEPAGTTRAT
jgi:heavy metal translocating P-type ATPase